MHHSLRTFLLFLFLAPLTARADLLLQPNDRVAICGAGNPAIFIEDYLIASQAVAGNEVEYFDNVQNPAGVVAGLNTGALGSFKPTVVIAGFGDDQTNMVDALKKAGVRLVVVNAPASAAKEGVVCADVNGATTAAILKAKALHGDQYAAQTGWPEAFDLSVASAYLKALGFDGNFGTVTIDFAAGTADGGADQKILSYKDNTVMVQSTRIPFCFPGHGVGGSDTPPWPALKCLTFEQDLNRYMLVVKNLPTAETKIYWGDANQDFPSEKLAKGINLEDIFPGFGNQFYGACGAIDGGVRSQREVERLSNWATDAPSEAKRAAARQLIKDHDTPVQSKITIVPLAPVAKQPPGPIPVILDTDLDSDVDDVGALALLNDFMDQGECKLLACVHNTINVDQSSCATIQAINTWYGHPSIPIGQSYGEKGPANMTSKLTPAPPDGYHTVNLCGSGYTKTVRQKFAPNFADDNKMPAGVDIYRKALASAADGSVVICSVGTMENIQDLIQSQPDSVSELSGLDLVRKKVRELVIMANTQPADHYLLSKWPTKITWTTYVGSGIGAGQALVNTPENNPVRVAYQYFGTPQDNALLHGRQCWDLTAAWLAVRGPQGVFDVVTGRPGFVNDITKSDPTPHPDECEVTIKIPYEDVSKLISDELIRPPKY
jgi:hypothetical protein